MLWWIASPAQSATVLAYDFNEAGNAPSSTGTSTRPVKTRGDDGSAADHHSAPGGGVSGFPWDRAFANTGPSDQGRFASSPTNGFRADQPDNGAPDSLASFTISGWFKTELADTFLPNATPRLVNNHDGGTGSAGDGFNLQFLTGSEGDLKLEVDDDTGGGVNTTGEPYSAKQTWVFFAVSYDGTLSIDNVHFYVGFRSDAEAGGGPGSAAVALVTTASLDRGAVDGESADLNLGNRSDHDRPFKGFLDEIRIDDSASVGPSGLALLEGYRQSALDPPRRARLEHADASSVSSSVLDQNATPVIVNELSGVTWDPNADRFWACSDESGRLLEMAVSFGSDGTISSAASLSGLTLSETFDFEGIAYTDAVRNSVFLSEEGSPGVREYDLSDGSLLQVLSVPAVFANVRPNRGFESLARHPDGSEMITGVEQALTADGPDGSSTSAGTVSRWLHYSIDGTTATPAAEWAYRVEPVHDTPVGGIGSGLAELVVLADGSWLALERSEGGGEFLTRIFHVKRAGATNVSVGTLGSGLIGGTYAPLSKTLLYSDDGFQKLEGLALGPELTGGGHALLGVEDSSTSPAVLHSFVLRGAMEPVPTMGPWGRALATVFTVVLGWASAMASARVRRSTDPEEREQKIDEAVAKTLAEFPPVGPQLRPADSS